MPRMGRRDPKRFWEELLRRRVVRAAVFYVAGAWILAQALDLLLDAFDASHYMRFVVAGLIIGLPIATVLAWMFDITPSGIERTPGLADPGAGAHPVTPSPAAVLPAVTPAPERSIAVLPFANLSQEAENEYFSDGLSEEIRNQLARVEGLRVAARTSSFAFKGRHEDVREIGRRLNVASVLEGGVRKHADTVRIDVQLVNTADGYQVWAESFERRLDDIFKLQTEVACAVIAAVRPRDGVPERPQVEPATRNFDAYNLYLLGRHHFHKRTDAALARAVDCFRKAIGLDSNYALAYSGLADAYALSSAGYYGNLPPAEAIAMALPAAERALELAPALAEPHASLGLIRHVQGRFEAAAQALEHALELNRGYLMAHVWLGLVLTGLGRYRDAAARNREAFRLDPLSPIVNSNVGFDALRFGDVADAEARFRTAMEVDPGFPVPYSGMARLESSRGNAAEAVRWTDRAIERAPGRAFYPARKGLFQLQSGDLEAAALSIEASCCSSPDNVLSSDLVLALFVARDDRAALDRVASGTAGRVYSPWQRAQALLVFGDYAAARTLYEELPPGPQQAIDDAINDEWVWRLPHVVNHAHLRLVADDARGRDDLEGLLTAIDAVGAQGVVNNEILYWSVLAHTLLGRHGQAIQAFETAVARGWRQAWWARRDWNLAPLLAEGRLPRRLSDYVESGTLA